MATVTVTRAQVLAAQGLMRRDRELGRETPDAVRKIAEAKPRVDDDESEAADRPVRPEREVRAKLEQVRAAILRVTDDPQLLAWVADSAQVAEQAERPGSERRPASTG